MEEPETIIEGAICFKPVQVVLKESSPLTCHSPNITSFSVQHSSSGSADSNSSDVTVHCQGKGSPKPTIQLRTIKCVSKDETLQVRMKSRLESGGMSKAFSEREYVSHGATTIGSIDLPTGQCCLIECKVTNTEGESTGELDTCASKEDYSITTFGGGYSLDRDSEDKYPNHNILFFEEKPSHWYKDIPVLLGIALGTIIPITVIVIVVVACYKSHSNKTRRWSPISGSFSVRGRDNYPAAVGLIPSLDSPDQDCDEEDDLENQDDSVC